MDGQKIPGWYIMWQMVATDAYEARLRWFEKKHPRETRAVLNNLGTYFAALQHGVKPRQIRYGFMHTEPMGVVAIAQKGGGASLAETRLYVYPMVEQEELHLIILGDKRNRRTQTDDIKYCRSVVEKLRQKGTDKDEPDKSESDGPNQGHGGREEAI